MQFQLVDTVDGVTLGTFEAATPIQALDTFAIERGYTSFEDACVNEAPYFSADEVVVLSGDQRWYHFDGEWILAD